jgi:hypothetical protein
MNHWTSEFLQADFSCYQHLTPKILPCDHMPNSMMPALPVDGFDIDIVNCIFDRAKFLSDSFLVKSSQTNQDKWFAEKRSQVWHELQIIPHDYGYINHHDGSKNFSTTLADTFEDQTIKDIVKKLFHKREFPIVHAQIFRLGKDGWIAPHMDTMTDNIGLGYFWMPLHQFPPCIKVFPWGWLNHQVGNLYMLNNSKYVHAVKNQLLEDRLVLIGRLDISKTPKWLIEHHNQFVPNHHQIWSHH